MAFAETANLAVKLTLGGNFTQQMAKATGQLKKFDGESRAFKAGTQIGTGIKRSAILAVAAIGTLTTALAFSVKQGQEAANVQKIYAQAISNSGKVTAANVDALNAQQKALENLAGIDDELIKSSQTRLIQMGLTGKQVEKATPLVLDFAKATGIDLLTATKLVGKAAQGNTGALSRYGVAIDKAKAKTDPFGATLDALNKKFGGTTKALSGSLDTRLVALRQNINDIAEDVGIKLLPALTKIVDVVGRKLVPALGKFVDRILPDVSGLLDDFANALENGGAENAIRGITDALGPMIDLVKIAAQPVKEIVKAFLSLPKEVQTVLVGAFAVNKLTGGLVTNVVGGIGESILKAFAGGIKAAVVPIQAGVVNVNGGIPGVGGGAGDVVGDAAKVGGAGALATSSILIGAAVASAFAFINTHHGADSPSAFTPTVGAAFTPKDVSKQDFSGLGKAIGASLGAADLKEAASQLRNAAHGIGNEQTKDSDQRPVKTATVSLPRKLDDLHAKAQQTAAAVKDADSSVKRFGSATVGAERAGAGQIVSAVRSIPAPITTVNTTVNVTAGGITKTTTIHQRYGPVGGSATDPRHLGYTPGGQ